MFSDFNRKYDICTGVSCFIGLAAVCLFIPLNHFAGKIIVGSSIFTSDFAHTT